MVMETQLVIRITNFVIHKNNDVETVHVVVCCFCLLVSVNM